MSSTNKGINLLNNYFDQSALKISPKLLGKVLCREINGKKIEGIITEVEAYIGPQDKACHAYKGLTQRTSVMFGVSGHWYVYLCYGMYWMLNVVVEKEGYPAAVLIRGIKVIKGVKETENKLLDGPGKITKAFKIDKLLNGKPIDHSSGLWIEDRGIVVPKSKIVRTARIGVDYAKEWRDKPYRFTVDKLTIDN